MTWDIRSWFLKPSTRWFLREAKKLSDFSLIDMLHGYFYLRWPYFYIGIGTGEHPLRRLVRPAWKAISALFLTNRKYVSESNEKLHRTTFADTYHGKVVPLEGAKQLVQVNRDIEVNNLEQVIPYSRARDIILQNPAHIVALECPCRASRPDPCLPLDVCLIIGDPFAGFVTEHHPRRSREISRGEAMDILQAEHERGHVHHAFFKNAMLDRFYAICNCCACCCGAMQAWNNGIPMLASSGYVSRIRTDTCIACGDCVEACQFGALRMGEDRVIVDEALCMGCGVCVSMCDQGGHQLVRDHARGEPLVIESLTATA